MNDLELVKATLEKLDKEKAIEAGTFEFLWSRSVMAAPDWTLAGLVIEDLHKTSRDLNIICRNQVEIRCVITHRTYTARIIDNNIPRAICECYLKMGEV